MQARKRLTATLAAGALAAGLAAPALAATYVYVSNAEDGELTTYTMQADGSLQAGPKVPVAKVVMPMTVSPDKRFLYAVSRFKPFSVYTYSINKGSGALTQIGTAPTADSFPYIALDQTGHWLLGASYGGHVISVNAVGRDGKVAEKPTQVIPVGRNAHSIRVDASNKYAYVPTLGTDAIFQFKFDAKTGMLSSNTPAVAMMKAGTGPRHFVTSNDNKYLYLLSEMVGTVTTMALDGKTGLLTEVGVVSGLAPDSKLVPGFPRGAVGAPGGPPPRDTGNDIWAADIHLTPNGKFLYISERTGSTINALSVDGASGKPTWQSATPTEKGPRGFRIDPKGKFMVVTGEKSQTISVYAIDQDNGSLKQVGQYPTGKGANWVEIVSFD